MATSIRHRLDMAEMEPLHNHLSRGGLPVSSLPPKNCRRRPHIAILITHRRYPWLWVAVSLVLGVCCWVEFRLGTRSTLILSKSARFFVQEIQRAYEKNHEPKCASASSSSNHQHPCGTTFGDTILSFQCHNGWAPTAGRLVKQSLSAYNPTLVCANQASASLPLQSILEQKYDLVLVESHSQSSEEEHVHDNLDFWKKMLLPHGLLALFCTADLIPQGSQQPLGTVQSPTTPIHLMPLSSPENEDLFLTRVTQIYKSKICSPLNKHGLFCEGNILSLDCDHSPSLRLLQNYMPGRGTLHCPQIAPTSSKRSDMTSFKFQKPAPLEDLLQRRYETIMLDTSSNNFPGNLELWSQLLVPGGIIAIYGTAAENPIPSEQYLTSLDLKAYYTSSTPPYLLIFVSRQQLEVQVSNTKKAREDEVQLLKQYQPNQGSVDTQIQLSPISFEDRYPTMYAALAQELLQNRPSSWWSCALLNKKKARTHRDASCGPIKVLSFGCSYGFEMKTLADKYLTGKAEIYGVDVNDPVVSQAQENVKVVETNKMVVVNGKTDPASNYGPFDAVFANSVLCYNFFPEPKDPVAKIKAMFPFETFEGLLRDIDGLVKVGGFLSLCNTNYLFNQTSLFLNKYQTYRDHDNPLCRQDVWLIAKDGTVVFNPRTDSRSAYTVYCVFVKIKE